jgi:hypothetical protein
MLFIKPMWAFFEFKSIVRSTHGRRAEKTAREKTTMVKEWQMIVFVSVAFVGVALDLAEYSFIVKQKEETYTL